MLYGRFPCFFHRIISPTQTTILNIIIIEHVQRRWCYNDASKEQLNLKLCEIVCVRLRVCVWMCVSLFSHTHIIYSPTKRTVYSQPTIWTAKYHIFVIRPWPCMLKYNIFKQRYNFFLKKSGGREWSFVMKQCYLFCIITLHANFLYVGVFLPYKVLIQAFHERNGMTRDDSNEE